MGPGGHRAGDVGRIVERREHHHPDGGQIGPDLLEGRQAILPRHADVEEHDIGLELLGQLQRLVAIGSLAQNLDLGAGKQAGETAANHFMVIGDEDFD